MAAIEKGFNTLFASAQPSSITNTPQALVHREDRPRKEKVPVTPRVSVSALVGSIDRRYRDFDHRYIL